MIGDTLGNRYRLLRELGAGGMAWVYLAEDQVKQVQVAVKVLYPQFNRDMSYVQRFVREAKLAMQISSNNIVRILDYGADRDVHYLVMENIQGQDLAAMLRGRGKLPWQEALEVTAQVVLALEAANAQGIVHRDIKPQNIMITPSGTVKVLDFGIARARTLPALTRTGFLGSPYYISPEQAMGKEVDIRSDIYSLGIVLYELLTGRVPFDASTTWSIISQHIAQEPPNLDLEDSELPPTVKELVRKMLAKDPADRFQAPGELLAAIESSVRGAVGPVAEPLPALAQADEVARLGRAHELLLSSLYERGIEALQAEEWPQAVNLFTQVTKVDPSYRDAADRLAHAGVQARLAALFSAATAALGEERWQEAIDDLSEIASIDTAYRQASILLGRAGKALAEAKIRERLDSLYEKGLAHYQEKEWQEASACFGEILKTDTNYKDAARLFPDASRRARWSNSVLGRMSHSLASWGKRSKKAERMGAPVLSSPVEKGK